MTRQYWADAATQNCVWIFQTKAFGVPVDAMNDEEAEPVNYWRSERVFLTKREADEYGNSRPYAWGAKYDGWRIWGVPCDGIMVDLLGQHNTEFEKDVEYITPYKSADNNNYMNVTKEEQR